MTSYAFVGLEFLNEFNKRDDIFAKITSSSFINCILELHCWIPDVIENIFSNVNVGYIL